MKKAICPNPDCNFEEEYEPDEEFGLTYFQCVGTCPLCESELVDDNGKSTVEIFEFKVNKP